MTYEWIKAPLALKYVSDEALNKAARHRICERAYAGMIAAKADLVISGSREERDSQIDRKFWWAEGGEALEQDWEAGDFSTWIDQKVKVQAFGVSFDFAALSELVPADRKAEALRRISAVDRHEWISARELADRLRKELGVSDFERAIVEASQLGQIGACALRAQGFYRDRRSLDWAAREWDVPLWFWRELVRPNHFQDWKLNKAHGDGTRNGDHVWIELQGVHFHRSGLGNIGLSEGHAGNATSSRASTGRRPKYDWAAASLAIFGLIHRGDLKPESQADVERALISHLSKGDKMPPESTARPYARLIWQEHNKA